ELDLDRLRDSLAALHLPVITVATRVTDRLNYLQRPDLGRRLDAASRAQLEQIAASAQSAPDIAIVVADGLSATAAPQNAAPLLERLVPRLRQAGMAVAPLVITRYGRVALQDDVGESLAARCSLIVLGE